MGDTPQKPALTSCRKRIAKQGLARFEVLGLTTGRELIRSLARRLAGKGPEATRIRTAVCRTLSDEQGEKGGVLKALRRSPLVGADLNVTRSAADDRKVHL